jgi:PST family polysaccharide transporter
MIIEVLFSDDFAPMSELFIWQLIGDVIRVTAWLFSFYLISKAKIPHFILVEVFVTLSFILLADQFIGLYGLHGVTIAYALNNLIYLVLLLTIVWRELRTGPQFSDRDANLRAQ